LARALTTARDSEKFITRRLDDTHLLVQPHKVDEIRRLVKELQVKNTYTAPTKGGALPARDSSRPRSPSRRRLDVAAPV